MNKINPQIGAMDFADIELENTLFVKANCAGLCAKMKEFSASDKYTDVNIICGDRTFRCHKLVLAAASAYFDTMFSSSFKESRVEDISLHDIDEKIFEQVLNLAYGSNVRIDDNNIYNLLRASEMLDLSSMEQECVRYLTERSIPLNYALDIFSFISLTGKEILIPVISRFILKYIRYFCRRSEFLEIPFYDMIVLISHYQSSLVGEYELLNSFREWASKSGNRTSEERQALYTELTQCITFKHLSTDCVTEYFHGNVTESVTSSDALDDPYVGNESSNVPTIHAYINILQDINPTGIPFEEQFTQSTLFMFDEPEGEMFSWQRTHVEEPAIDRMRTIVLNDELYCMRLQGKQYSLCVCASIDLCTHVRPLRMPPIHLNPMLKDNFSLCCDTQNIYMSGGSYRDLFVYNSELDRWFPIQVPYRELIRSCMTCDDRRLYLIGGNNVHGFAETGETDSRLRLRAYDHREGKWEKLRSSNGYHGVEDESCCFEEKIYVSCLSSGYSKGLDVYDSVAGKWRSMILPCGVYNSHRILSFENEIWVFSSDEENIKSFFRQRYIPIQVYDPSLQQWITSPTLNDAIAYEFEAQVENTRWRIIMTDVTVFKPVGQ